MFSISSYFSVQYLAVLLPATVLLYAICPEKVRRWVLLAASYTFFWAISGKLLIYLLVSTLSIHHIGLWLADVQSEGDKMAAQTPKEQRKEVKARYLKKQRAVMIFAVVLHIGLLVTLKYTPFFATNINVLFEWMGLSFRVIVPQFALPIGISFYSLQAVSYMFDVYRRQISADRNLLRLALFMSFFPQIMEGPICRYAQTAEQLWRVPRIDYKNLTFGLQRITFGVMKKLVVADRLNLFIKNVFEDYAKYDGFIIAVAAVFYTIQLYMDFSGTMDLVIGSGQIFGMKLPENFQRPFCSASISEFWKRWHITLGAWFKDYIFYPLSMSKPLKKLTSRARKKIGNYYGPLLAGGIALFAVWISNGLWHGAGWNYIFFGLYHFVLILGESVVEPWAVKITKKLHIERKSLPYRVFQIIRTIILVCIGELFFRAEGLQAGFTMFGKIFTNFSLESLWSGRFFKLGVDGYDILIVLLTVLILWGVGLAQERGIVIREKIADKNIVVRYAAYYGLVLFIIIFGAYGAGYIPLDPIYAGF